MKTTSWNCIVKGRGHTAGVVGLGKADTEKRGQGQEQNGGGRLDKDEYFFPSERFKGRRMGGDLEKNKVGKIRKPQ